MNTTRLMRSAAFIGPVVAIVVGTATASVRDEVGSTIVGVALATTVTVAALISRAAALTTASAAAITFNFFHTEPYHSLRIHDSGDVVIVALLLGLGVAISDVTAWIRRRERLVRQHAIADLPATGAAVPIRDAGRSLGFLVITPLHGHTALTVRRSVVLALAAIVTSAITASAGLTDLPTAVDDSGERNAR